MQLQENRKHTFMKEEIKMNKLKTNFLDLGLQHRFGTLVSEIGFAHHLKFFVDGSH